MSGYQPLLPLLFTALYLLTASCTPHMENNERPVIQNLPKFFAREIPDDMLQDGHVIFTPIGLANRKKSDDKEAQNQGKVARVNVLNLAVMHIETEAFHTSKTPKRMACTPIVPQVDGF